jgi:hypothetical protein
MRSTDRGYGWCTISADWLQCHDALRIEMLTYTFALQQLNSTIPPMSYGLSVYRIPQQMLDRVFGKDDHALLHQALDATKDDLADYDAQMDAPDLDTYDVDLSHADAMKEIFAGKFTEYVNGSRYGWAFECLCRFIGTPLSNNGFSPCDMEGYEQLDEWLKLQGVPLKFMDLIFQSPIPIPRADDWPCVGHWGADAIAVAEPLARVLPNIEDQETKEAMETALGWLRDGAKHSGSIIVGFHG